MVKCARATLVVVVMVVVLNQIPLKMAINHQITQAGLELAM